MRTPLASSVYRATARGLLVAVAWFGFASCSPPPPAEVDSGIPDGSTLETRDGGDDNDAGETGDAGSSLDGGTLFDAGTPRDGGEPDGGMTLGTPYVYVVTGDDQVRVHTLDGGSGALNFSSAITRAGSLGFLAFSPTGRTAYLTNGATVEALAINPATGALSYLNSVSAGGAGSTHVFAEPSGRYVLVANYSGNNASVLPVRDGGALGPATHTVSSGTRAHQIITDPSNRFVFVPCLGDDRVAQYIFNFDAGTLVPNAVPYVDTANGAGPRHLAFHPSGRWAYLINETNSTLTALTFNSASGRLTPFQTLSTLPAPMAGNSTAEVAVHPNGKFVYGSNRGHNSIVAFALDGGTMTLIGHASTGGMTPRHFSIDTSGTLLLVGNQASGTLFAFRINAVTGALVPLGEAGRANAPSFVGFHYLTP